MTVVPHHLHKRKRVHELHQEYPHPDTKIRVLDSVVMVASVVAPLTALPQVYNVWFLQNVAGVSLLTWVLFTFFTVPFLLYGVVHKLRQIIILNLLWFLIDVIVITGLLVNA